MADEYLTENPQFDRRRNGERLLMCVPVEVRGKAADGTILQEKTHTGVVGVLGAMVRISHLLPTGSEVAITNRLSMQTAQFRVVWVKDGESENVWEIGIESLKPLQDFWGVGFPRIPSD